MSGACIPIHNLSKTDEHNIWRGILQRCYNPKRKKYAIYGARGITVCDHWRYSFLNFYNDMGPRPSKQHSVERIDNNGNYCIDNCRWATKKEQARNRVTSRIIEFNGERKCLAEWSEITNIGYSTITRRLKNGWTTEAALFTPVKNSKAA